MSVILIRVFSSGVVFAADRNVTVNGVCTGAEQTTKVCKSNDGKILIGSIGAGTLAGKDALGIIKEVVDAYEGTGLKNIAREVHSAIQDQRLKDDNGTPKPQIVNIAGFQEREHIMVPEVWYISNCYELTAQGNYADVRPAFGCSDEVRIKAEASNVTPAELRDRLKRLEDVLKPFGFQHSINLAKFNVLDQFARLSDIHFRTPTEKWARTWWQIWRRCSESYEYSRII